MQRLMFPDSLSMTGRIVTLICLMRGLPSALGTTTAMASVVSDCTWMPACRRVSTRLADRQWPTAIASIDGVDGPAFEPIGSGSSVMTGAPCVTSPSKACDLNLKPSMNSIWAPKWRSAWLRMCMSRLRGLTGLNGGGCLFTRVERLLGGEAPFEEFAEPRCRPAHGEEQTGDGEVHLEHAPGMALGNDQTGLHQLDQADDVQHRAVLEHGGEVAGVGRQHLAVRLRQHHAQQDRGA